MYSWAARRWAILSVLVLLLAVAAPAAASSQAAAPNPPRPTVAVVLSGGAARGISHIGMIEALEENGIPVDLIVGTSMGSIIGGLYAAGYSTTDLRQIVRQVDYARLFTPSFPPKGGVLATEPFAAFLDCLLEGKTFEQLSLPFYAVSTDLTDRQVVVLHEGPVSRAVLASMTIPILFTPVRIGEAHLVDGGLRNTVPADVARDLGADVVIAVNVKAGVSDANYNSLLNVFQLSLYFMIDGYADQTTRLADVVIVPDVMYDSYMEYGRVDYFVRKGYEAAQRAMPAIKAALARRSPDFPYWVKPPVRDHPPGELQALLARAYTRAQEASRPLTTFPLVRAQAGSQPQLAIGFEGTGGDLGSLRRTYGYRWDFDDPAAGYHALSFAHPAGPWRTEQAYLKYYPAWSAVCLGGAVTWAGPRGWHAALSAERSPLGPHLRWQVAAGRTRDWTEALTVHWQLSAGRQAPSDTPGGLFPPTTGDREFASALAGVAYCPFPDGWSVWEIGIAFPQILAEIEQIAPGFTEAAGGSPETWVRAGATLDIRIFGFLPLKLRLLAGQELNSRRPAWTLDLGQAVSWP